MENFLDFSGYPIHLGFQRRAGQSEMNHEGHEKHEGVLAMQNAVGIDDRTPTGFCIHSQGVLPLGFDFHPSVIWPALNG